MTPGTENNASENWTEKQTLESSACSKATSDYLKPITREEIKDALKKVYVEETKPVNVGNIKARSGFALVLIVIGTIIITGVVGIKFLAFEPYLMLIGLIILLGTFTLGFSLSTKNIRKIYLSMRRFKNMNVPTYRKVFPKTTFQAQGLVYATLLCLIFLGAQSVNFLFITGTDQNLDNDLILNDLETIKEKTPSIINVNPKAYEISGQNYFNVEVKLNISNNYYSEDLILNIQSWFAGKSIDETNVTLLEPDPTDIIYVPIKIHEPDDTALKISLKKLEKTGEITYSTWDRPSQKDIYIAKAEGVISKNNPFTKSIEISVVVYNGGEAREAESLSLIVTDPSVVGPLKYRGSTENNETVSRGKIWETTFKFDILDEESVFDVELKIKEDTKDEIRVDSS